MIQNNAFLRNILIFEDEDILVINKPSGILTIPDGYDHTIFNLYDELNKVYSRIWTVHRLDKDTSGILIFSKNAVSHKHLSLQFQNRQVKKNYLLLVHNTPLWQSTTLDLPLKTNSGKKHRTVIDPKSGKPAQTSFRVIKRYPDSSLLLASPHTGYTHQIRAHICFAGFSILNDDLYTSSSDNFGKQPGNLIQNQNLPLKRLALHSFSIKFSHPKTNVQILLKAQLPDDFINTLFILRSSSIKKDEK